jgi:RND family efflux transporter MFP subunit
MTLLRTTLSVSLAALLSPLAASCGKSSSGEELPPAQGEGAPPREKLPEIAPAVTADRATGGTERTTGTTYPLERAEVSPDMSAIIASVEVEEGDPVKKGQVLFRMRTDALRLAVEQGLAQLRSAEVALSASRVEHDRMQRLLQQNATDQAQYDRVKAQFDGATVGVEQAKVALAQTRRALNDASARSPIDGVVTEVRKNAGEMATMMPITVVLVVEDQSQLELRFRLPESALTALKPGDSVKARFEAIGAERTARVHRISPALDLRTRTFEVIARIDNQDGTLKSGMLAAIRLARGPAGKQGPAEEASGSPGGDGAKKASAGAAAGKAE